MPVKILHAADLHMDSPFDSLPEDKAAIRRREQRGLLDRIAALAEEEKVQVVLFSGDLLDSSASYFETLEALENTFSKMRAEIFIAPGNHDFYCAKSPYAYGRFPDNVHIFTSPQIRCFELPALGCRVWGAGFQSPLSRPLLSGFSVPDADIVDIMALHGDTGGDQYNHVSESDIRSSGLDYLALGHIHSFSGIQRAGKTAYAYPGCPEGRGFDETGEKGVVVGSVSKSGCSLDFVPLGLRQYRILNVGLTGREDVYNAVLSSITPNMERDVCRVVLSGEYDGDIDCEQLSAMLSDRFFHVSVRNLSHPRRDVWAAAGKDTLKGIFLRNMREQYDAADESGKNDVMLAVRYGLAALENGEEPQS